MNAHDQIMTNHKDYYVYDWITHKLVMRTTTMTKVSIDLGGKQSCINAIRDAVDNFTKNKKRRKYFSINKVKYYITTTPITSTIKRQLQ